MARVKKRSEPGVGHNNPPDLGGIAVDRLRSIIERVERLEAEKKEISDGIKDVMAEARSAGFDAKAIKTIIKIRRQEPAEVQEHRTLVDLYGKALGVDTGDDL